MSAQRTTSEPIFTVEYHYKQYLRLMGLPEDQMHPQQAKQLKEAFYGAIGQFLVLMRDEVSLLSEQQGIQVFENMLKEVGTYWTEQLNHPLNKQP